MALRNPYHENRPEDPAELLGTCLEDIVTGLADKTPTELGKCPADWYENRIGYVYSNFDKQLDFRLVERLRHGNCSAAHSAWNFHGTIWFDGKLWYEDIRQYRKLVATLESSSIEELVRMANERYGSE